MIKKYAEGISRKGDVFMNDVAKAVFLGILSVVIAIIEEEGGNK